MLRLLAVGLVFLWAIDAVEANAFRVVIVQDFNGVAVEDADDGAGEIRGMSRYAQREHNNARTVDQPEELLCPGGPTATKIRPVDKMVS
jgi:hypothetical protein